MRYKIYFLSMILFFLLFISCIPEYQTRQREVFLRDLFSGEIDWNDVHSQAKKDRIVNLYFIKGTYDVEDWKKLFYSYFLSLGIDVQLFSFENDEDILHLKEMFKNREDDELKSKIIDLLIVDRRLLIEFEKDFSSYLNLVQFIPNNKKISRDIASTDSILNSEDGGIFIGYSAVPIFSEFFLTEVNTPFVVGNPLETFEDFYKFLQQYPQKFIYPDPRLDENGLGFVKLVLRSLSREKVEALYDELLNSSEEDVIDLLSPAFEYLKSISPYLWQKGTSYPPSNKEIEKKFLLQELYVMMRYQSFSPRENQQSVIKYIGLPKKGILMRKKYLVIPDTALHIASALVFMNEVLSDTYIEKQDFFLGKNNPIANSLSEAVSRKSNDDFFTRQYIEWGKVLKSVVPDIHWTWDELLIRVWTSYILEGQSNLEYIISNEFTTMKSEFKNYN